MIKHAFVTGATGLLGGQIVRALVARNIEVSALVRSREKAAKMFGNLKINFVEGDILQPESYRVGLKGCDALFHTAAFFRDALKGGKHWQTLYNTNVVGTKNLLQVAYEQGVRRVVHTSSIGVLEGKRGQVIDETMLRSSNTSNDYYRSKILSDEAVLSFLDTHPDMFACFVLPGWMFAPADMGPTSSGQFILDFLQKKLPGVMKASFSPVDARDVAEHQILAMEKGRRGERYLAAGRHLEMREIMAALAQVSGVPMPTRKIPNALLWTIAYLNEFYHFLTKKPILLSRASVKGIEDEYDCTRFSHEKSARELGASFRPFAETLKDTIAWYRENGWIK